jgi:predicted phage baseplate assembly protein
VPLIDQLPVLDDRRFEDLVEEARARIPRYTREWTDLNDSDPGITLVQLFAWLGELLLFRLNEVPELNYIKFLELVGIELEPACPARAYLSFPVDSATVVPFIEVRARTQVATAEPDPLGPVIFETERRLLALKAKLDAVRVFAGGVYHEVTAVNDAPAESWEPLGSGADPGNALVLGFNFDQPFPPLIELALTFWSAADATTGAVTCGGGLRGACRDCLTWEYHDGRDWRRLVLLRDETDALARTGQVLLKTPAKNLWQRVALGGPGDAPRFWLRAGVRRKGWLRVPRLLAVRHNTVAATQGETVEGEVLGGSDGTADQTFRVNGQPVLDGTLIIEIDEGRGFLPWREVDDLAAAGRDEPAYALDRSAGIVRFPGIRGRIPVANPDRPASNIRAKTYRFGGGRRGNVDAGKLTTLITSVPGIDAAGIVNLFAAVGGDDEESLDDAKRRAARSLKARDRAVTVEDFETLAMAAGPIGRVKALPLFHPDFPTVEVPGVVTLVVVPDEPGPAPLPSVDLLEAVCRCLDRRRLLTTEVHVAPPRYLPIKVTAEVVAPDGTDTAELREAAVMALDGFFHPLTGGADGEGWPFGGDVFFSAVHQRLLQAGAARVLSATIELDETSYANCTDVPVPPGALLASAGHEVSVLEEFAQ